MMSQVIDLSEFCKICICMLHYFFSVYKFLSESSVHVDNNSYAVFKSGAGESSVSK